MAILLAPAIIHYAMHGHTVDMDVVSPKQPSVDDIELSVDGDPHHVLHPKSITPNIDAPMAIVFVVEGSEQWIGNDTIETDPNKQYAGYLKNVEAAVDRMDLVPRVPPGSEVGIVTYATGAKVRMPLSPLDQLHGASFGTQQDYRGEKGNDLLKGVELGLDQASRAGARTKLVILIADGKDTDMATVPQRLAALQQRARTEGIAIEVLYEGGSDVSAEPIVPFASGRRVNSVDGVLIELTRFVDDHRHSFRATFDIQKLPVWDNKPHNVELQVNGVDTPPTPMVMGYLPIPAWWRTGWFKLALGAMCLAPFFVLGLRRIRATA